MGWLGLVIAMVMTFALLLSVMFAGAGLIGVTSDPPSSVDFKISLALAVTGTAVAAAILYLFPIFIGFWDWSGGFSLYIGTDGIRFETR